MRNFLVPLTLLLTLAACSDSTESTPQTGGAGQTQNIRELRSQVAFNQTPNLDASQKSAIVNGNNAFGFDLYREVIKAPGAANNNVFLSPASVSFALGMTSAGAKGDTLTELENGLHFSLPQPTTHAGFNWLKQELMGRPAEALATQSGSQNLEFDLNLVNSLWVDNHFEPVPGFLDLLAREYNAGLLLQDFAGNPDDSRKNLNGWVAQETKQRVQDLLPVGSIASDTHFVLVNAVSLGAPWAFPFSKQATENAPFTTLAGSQMTVPMMTVGSAGINTPYLADDDIEAAGVPLLGGKLSVVLVVPRPGKFAAVEASLSAEKFDAIQSAMHSEQVEVKVPRFKFTSSSLSLLQPLQALGIKKPFSEEADFSGISTSTKVEIFDVVHKAMVAFNEDGIEAAAATAVFDGESVPPPAVPFVVDRPFFMAIKDVTGAVLFWGRVTQPEGG